MSIAQLALEFKCILLALPVGGFLFVWLMCARADVIHTQDIS